MARVYVLKETRSEKLRDGQLCLRWCRYELDDGTQHGYRFIWRTENGSLHAARGQARIRSIAEGKSLMDRALTEGWGERDGEAMKKTAGELHKRGCVVNLATGYVGWPNREVAITGQMTPKMMEWERIIREWS
jgi:hypothetical protein